MISYEEHYGSIYAVEDGKQLFIVENPAAVIDTEYGIIHKIGDKSFVSEEFDRMCAKAKGTGLTDTWVMVDLPKDIELLNKSLNITGYLHKFLKDKGVF